MALIAQKTQDKADLETDLNDDKADMKGKTKARALVEFWAVKWGDWRGRELRRGSLYPLSWGFKCNIVKVKPLARDLSFA